MKHDRNGAILILFKDNTRQEVYSVYRPDYKVWNLTGGGKEEGESFKEAAMREAKEETSFKVKFIRKLGYGVKFDKSGKVLNQTDVFEGRIISGTFKPEFPGNIGAWFNVNHLPSNMSFKTREIIQRSVKVKDKEFYDNSIDEPFWGNIKYIICHPFRAKKYILEKMQDEKYLSDHLVNGLNKS